MSKSGKKRKSCQACDPDPVRRTPLGEDSIIQSWTRDKALGAGLGR